MSFKVKGFHFGHPIYTTDGKNYRYEDNDELVDDNKPRKCPACDRYPTEEGHDPCIANLPGVKYACCGHGIAKEAYVFFETGQVIRGRFDLDSLK